MATSTVGVRLPEELIERLQAVAKIQNKKVSDVVRELIEAGLASQGNGDTSTVLARIDELNGKLEQLCGRMEEAEGPPILRTVTAFEEAEKRLSVLLSKAIKAAAAGQFYARTGALETIDLVSIWSAQIGAPENEEARKEAAGRLDADSQEFAEWWLKGG